VGVLIPSPHVTDFRTRNPVSQTMTLIFGFSIVLHNKLWWRILSLFFKIIFNFYFPFGSSSPSWSRLRHCHAVLVIWFLLSKMYQMRLYVFAFDHVDAATWRSGHTETRSRQCGHMEMWSYWDTIMQMRPLTDTTFRCDHTKTRSCSAATHRYNFQMRSWENAAT